MRWARNSNVWHIRWKCHFKDNADVPDDIYGWSVQRSRQLGEDLLIGVNAVVKKLKASEQ